MSDMSQGPGWWIASDDKWYPPHLHPSVRDTDTPEPEHGHSDQTVSETVSSAETAAASIDPAASPGVASVHASPGPDTTSSAKRPRVPLLVSIVVVILLIVGAVVVFGNSENASATVINAVNSTLNNGSAHVTMNLSGTAAGTTVTGNGSGSIDFVNNALQLQMTVGAEGEQVPVGAIYLGGVIYETIPGLDTIAPGKSWLSIDLSALQKAEQREPSTQELGDNPTVMLQMLAQQGNTVVPLGPSTLNGVAVNGYAVTVDPSSAALQLKKANLPSWMQQAVAGLKVHTVGIKVYIDKAGLLRSFAMNLNESSAAAGAVTVNETLNLSDYGTPVTVTAPPASQVESFQQLLEIAGTQGTTPTS
jgi:hypothetical protein